LREERESLKPDDDSPPDALTDKELADILGVSVQTTNYWRHGKRSPTGKHKDLFKTWEVQGERWARRA
jgi:DNA-binding transcriptional regulator YiaG